MGGTGPRKKWMKKEVRMDELFRIFFRIKNESIFLFGLRGRKMREGGDKTYVSTRMLMKY